MQQSGVDWSRRLRVWVVAVGTIVTGSACAAIAQTQPAAGVDDPNSLTNPEAIPGAPSVKPSKQSSRFSRPAEVEIGFQEGLLQYSRGQLRQAEQKFQDVIKADPADADGYYYLGLSQLDQNRAKDAVENFDQSIRLDPTSDEVRLARASALIRLRRLDDAERDIKVLEKDPRWTGAVHYLRGHLYYNEGKLDKAADEFKASQQSGQPEATNARLYGGLTYLRMKNLAQARRSFRDAATSADGGDLAVTSAAEQVDATLGRAVAAQRRLDARVSVGYEYDSNVIQNGTDSPLPVGITGQSDSSLVIQPRLGYALVRKGPIEFGVEGSGYFSFHKELNDFDIESYQAGPYLDWKTSKETRVGLRYGYNYLRLGSDPYLTRNIITPSFLWFRANVAYTQVYYQYQTYSYQQSVALDAFDRDGDSHRVGILQGIYLPALFKDADRTTLELSYRYEHQWTQGNDFQGNFHTVGLTYYIPLPVWNLKADFGASLNYDGYSNPNSIENNPTVVEAADSKRHDWEWRLGAGVTKKFNDWLSFRIDYTYTKNDSNIETAGTSGFHPYEFDRQVVGARLIFSY